MEAERGGSFWPETRANSRRSVVPVRCGFSRLEAFDEIGKLGWDGARLPAVLAGLGSQGFKATRPIAQRPIPQGIDGDGSSPGAGDLVVASRDLLGAPGEFAARQGFEHQGSDQTIAEQGSFFGFALHTFSLLTRESIREEVGKLDKCCVFSISGVALSSRAWRDDRGERENAANPTGAAVVPRTRTDAR